MECSKVCICVCVCICIHTAIIRICSGDYDRLDYLNVIDKDNVFSRSINRC